MIGTSTPATGTPAPTTDGIPRLPMPQEAPTTPTQPPVQRRAHLPRWLLAGLVLLVAGAAVAWYAIRTDWAPPWAEPPGPLTASGTLEADDVMVGSVVAARIVELAREGQSVQANDVVARLDDSLVQVQIQQGDVAARQRLDVQADQYILRSPISGVITNVPTHVGEVASPGETIATVADLSVLKLTAYVLERDLGQVRIGQEVSIAADPFPGRTFRGVVTATNPRAEFTPRNVQTKADRLNLVFGVRVLVDNPDGALKPGMPVDVTFTTPPSTTQGE